MTARALALALLVLPCSSEMTAATEIRVELRTQKLGTDSGGHNQWVPVLKQESLAANQTALLICDMWDQHWSRGATERVTAMAPRMNQVVQSARAKGILIIHCPSETMDFYQDSPARKRMQQAPHAPMPPESPHANPRLPIDDSDGGSDTGEKPWHKAWSRQHPAIEIDQAVDGVSDNGQEVWNFLAQHGIRNLLVMGVHTNMCVLGRPFAIKTMVRRGMNVILVRDLTDAMYNPARAPYVSHEEGTRLVVEYIEKFWCPTITSQQLLAGGQTSGTP